LDYFTVLFNDDFYDVCSLPSVALMDELEMDEEYLIARAKRNNMKVTMQQEDEFMARVRVLVIDQKKSNSEARGMAVEEMI